MTAENLIAKAKCLLLFFDSYCILVQRTVQETTLKQIDWGNTISALSTNYDSRWHFGKLRLHKIVSKGDRETSVCSVAPGMYQIRLEKYSLKVPLPGAVIIYDKPDLRILAYKGELKADSQLYHYPLPNINHLGRVCWGGVLPPDNIDDAWARFIESTFNADYDKGKSQSHLSVLAKLSSIAIAGDKTYPEEDLVSFKTDLASFFTSISH